MQPEDALKRLQFVAQDYRGNWAEHQILQTSLATLRKVVAEWRNLTAAKPEGEPQNDGAQQSV